MSFLFGNRKAPQKPSIDCIHLDLTGWKLMANETHKWIKPGPDLLGLLYFDVPTQLPCSLDDSACWPPYFANMITKDNGAVVSVDVLPIQGMKAVRTIFKYHQPKLGDLSDLGITYLGTWMVPFMDFSFNIQMQSFEAGTTGTREAGVMLLLSQQEPRKEPEEQQTPQEPPVLTTMEEFFNRVRTRPMMRIRADDEEFDEMFPDHPLSRLRAGLQHIADTLHVDDVIRNARPYKMN